MTAGFAIASSDIERAYTQLSMPVESAGIARAIPSAGGTLLLGPIEWITDTHYVTRAPRRLELRSSAWAPSMIDIAKDGHVPVFVHTHPNGEALFSTFDDEVDATISTEIARLAGASTVASLVIAGTPGQVAIAGRRSNHGTVGEPEVVRVAGPRLRLHLSPGAAPEAEAFDRQDRAYGTAGRRVLNALTVGIVGAGGTGSPTHEQVLRLGVGTVISVDDDIVTESTPTRGYGSGMSDKGALKVDVMARLNEHIGLGSRLLPVPLNVRDPAAEDALATCDVVFGCTDGHHSRIVLNRLAYYHLVPVIDLGVLVSPEADGGVRIDGRVTVIGPGAACLICRNRISFDHARAENLDPETRRAQAAEGYVPDVDEPAPAVVTYTTLTSALGVSTLLHRLFDIGDNTHTELIVRPDTSTIRTNIERSRPGCLCGDPLRWGQGFTTPRLGLT